METPWRELFLQKIGDQGAVVSSRRRSLLIHMLNILRVSSELTMASEVLLFGGITSHVPVRNVASNRPNIKCEMINEYPMTSARKEPN